MSRAVSLELQHSTNRTVFAEKKPRELLHSARLLPLHCGGRSQFTFTFTRSLTKSQHTLSATKKKTRYHVLETRAQAHTQAGYFWPFRSNLCVRVLECVCVHTRLEGNADCRLPLPFCRRRRSPRESGATLTSSTLSWRNVLRRAYCALPARIRRKTFNCAPRVCLSKHKHTCAMQRCNQLIMDVRKRNQVIFVYELSAVEMHVSERVSRVCVASRRVGSAAPSADLVDGQFIYPPPGTRVQPFPLIRFRYNPIMTERRQINTIKTAGMLQFCCQSIAALGGEHRPTVGEDRETDIDCADMCETAAKPR